MTIHSIFYGGLISSSGPLAGANTMHFSSKPAISSAMGLWGFYDYGYRFYDPANQRWLNRGPLEEGGIGLDEVAGTNRAKQVYDAYQACMLSCASLGASASGAQLN